jgi:tRNA pseudouridine13 synthase
MRRELPGAWIPPDESRPHPFWGIWGRYRPRMRLLPGAAHFQVTEIPAYPPSGAGEHLYVRIEKENANTDDVALALARACGRPARDVGYAGRKDRSAIARQWFSVRLGAEADLARLAAPAGARLVVLELGRHRNKLRLGHLAGNRFRLGLAGADRAEAVSELRAALERLTLHGVENRFGAQRFGQGAANLALARAWASGDAARAAALCVDPAGNWRPGAPLPDEYRPGLFGRVVGALRRAPGEPERALRAAGRTLAKLLASAAQSAVFNAVLDARREAGLLHSARPGDVLRRAGGGLFRAGADDAAEASERAAPGRLEVFATGPLPGEDAFAPSPEVLAEERRWSAAAGVEWAWFDAKSPLASPGARRELVVPFVEPPALELAGDLAWLSFALPPGSYATELLTQCGVEARGT